MLNLLLKDTLLFIFSDLPGTFEHLDEVNVGGDAHGELSVVVEEFVPGNCTVSFAPETFEVVEELG